MRNFIIALTTTALFVALSQTSSAQFRENGKQADPNAAQTNAGQTNAGQTKAMGFIVQPPNATTVIPPVVHPKVGSFVDQHNGVSFEALSFGTGIRVKGVDAFGLGARNGLEVGDVVKEFNGRAVSNQLDMTNAVKSIPPTASGIFVKIVDVNSGVTRQVPFTLSTNAGIYQTNFGVLELTEGPTTTPGVTNWAGTLRFKNTKFGVSKITGSLANGQFSGTSKHPTFGTKQVSLKSDFTGNMFQGSISDSGGPMTFVIIKR